VKGALYRDMAAGFRQEDVEFTKKLNELQERLRHDVRLGFCLGVRPDFEAALCPQKRRLCFCFSVAGY